jgi:Domain of unknown function (DUF4062)/S-layer homology domain
MDKRYQVFISSTFVDLQNEREAIYRDLMRLGCIPVGMELFPAANEDQFSYIKKIIDQSDIYILIIGGRYGSLAEDGMSFTEKEYHYAVSKGLEILVFPHRSPQSLPRFKTEENRKSRKKLEAFRDLVSSNRLADFWDNSNELTLKILISVVETTKNITQPGWLRGDKAKQNIPSRETSKAIELSGLEVKKNDDLIFQVSVKRINSSIIYFDSILAGSSLSLDASRLESAYFSYTFLFAFFGKVSPKSALLLEDIGKNTLEERTVISLVLEVGILLQYPDDTFRGNQNMTRYEFATLFARIFSLLRKRDERITFPPPITRHDVPDGHWGEIAIGFVGSLISSESEYRGSHMITRGEMATAFRNLLFHVARLLNQ